MRTASGLACILFLVLVMISMVTTVIFVQGDLVANSAWPPALALIIGVFVSTLIDFWLFLKES